VSNFASPLRPAWSVCCKKRVLCPCGLTDGAGNDITTPDECITVTCADCPENTMLTEDGGFILTEDLECVLMEA